MNEPDPLIARLRDLPSPAIDAKLRARVLDQATRVATGEAERSALVRAWSVWALPAVLLACEAVYVADWLGKLRAIFFG